MTTLPTFRQAYEDLKKSVISDYVAGVPCGELRKKYGVSAGSVMRWTRGCPRHRRSREQVQESREIEKLRKELKAEQAREKKERVRELYVSGAHMKEISTETGVPEATVHNWTRDLPRRARPYRRALTQREREDLAMARIDADIASYAQDKDPQ